MVTSTALDRGPLSWQQEVIVRTAREYGSDILWTAFEIPEDVSNDELVSRLDRMVRREDGLRIVAVDRTGVTYARAMTLPIHHARCAGPAELTQFIAQNKQVAFEPGEPPWRLTIIEHRDAVGCPARTVLAVFDFVIADMASLALLRRELCTGVPPSAQQGAGRYRQWVHAHRAEFDVEAPEVMSAAREFWTGYLGGASPSRWTPLPAVTDAEPGQPHGTVRLSTLVPVSAGQLRIAARRARATPYSLIVASVVATISAGSGVDDISLRLINTGRVPGSASMFGRLSVSTPIRLCRSGLGDFDNAVAAVRSAWQQVLPHQHTPWDFIRTVCTGSKVAVWEATGRRQLIVNFLPEPVSGLGPEDFADKRVELQMTHVELQVVPLAGGNFMFRMLFDGGDLDVESVRRFLSALAEGFTTHVRKHAETSH